MGRQISGSILIAFVLLSGCNSMADLEREMSIVIEQGGQEGMGGTGINRTGEEGQEGIGGSGHDPDFDGIGGTGIIGLVTNQEALSVGGIQLQPSSDVAVFIAGEPASLGQLASGQTAAILVDAGSQVQQIHVFTAESGPPGFLQDVGKLLVRGDIGQLNTAGVSIPDTVASSIKSGQPVQLQAIATSSGVFRVESITPVNPGAPQALPSVIRPAISSITPGTASQSTKPAVAPAQQSTGAPVTPVQPAQPVIVTPPTTQTVTQPVTQPTISITPEPVTPDPVQPIRTPVVDVASPASVSLPTAVAPQTPASGASSAVQPVSPPPVTEPPVVTTPPPDPKSPDIAIEIMQPTDATAPATRP